MSIKYDSKRQLLADVIKKSSQDATYLIPDLQRPYVWTPKQVILLIDSLFRGWPFGSLLLWEVASDCYAEGEGIPSRSFWQVVDRTDGDKPKVNSTMAQPTTYYMVLDGQQRIQSMLLALGGDSWGFKLYDHEWSMNLHEKRMRTGRHWSSASLCMDMDAFAEEIAAKNSKVRRIEIGNILSWVVTDQQKGRSTWKVPSNYEHPLLSAWEHSGRFIRLSRMWNLAENGLTESDYRDLLEPFLYEHNMSDDRVAELKQPLAEFMKTVELIKTTSHVHALQIETLKVTPQWTKDDYDDAIVNIFTRLNTAGRTLTREEITLAWLKVGWDPSKTNNLAAGDCLDALRSEIEDFELSLSMDDTVRLLSFVWSVETRSGKLLDSRDLLKGDIIRPMAEYLSNHWQRICDQVTEGARIIQERSLYENMGSTNALIVFWAWKGLADSWLLQHQGLPLLEKDSYEKDILSMIKSWLDQWVIGSQWSNVWAVNAVQNFRTFAELIGRTANELRDQYDRLRALDLLRKCLADLIDEIQVGAISYVEHLSVKERKKVFLYRSALWVWHRLDESRWELSAIPMKTGRKRKSKLEVDHTVADALWKRKVESEMEVKTAALVEPSPEALMELAPDGFESKDEAVAFINCLGNCALLDKSFNISKSDGQLWDFLKEVHEFKPDHQQPMQRDDWQSSMAIDDVLMEPKTLPLKQIKDSLKKRDTEMRNELIDFLKGSRQRKDV